MRTHVGMACFIVLTTLSGCGTDSPTEPEIEAGRLRFEFAGAETGTFEVGGFPVFPIDNMHDFVTLSEGSVNGIGVSHQVLAVNAATSFAPAGFDQVLVYLNPSINQSGQYDPGDCPLPAEVGGCVWISARLGVPQQGGIAVLTMAAIQDSVSITINHLSADTLRGAFQGTFSVSRSGQPAQRVHVSGGSFFAFRSPQN